MALNQTQRDHAIKMIEAAINEKKQQYRVAYIPVKEFIAAYCKTNMIKTLTIDLLLEAEKESYRSFAFIIDLMKVLKITDLYDTDCRAKDQAYQLSTAGLTALEFDLKGQVMFGNDFAVISEAMERIANFE